MKKISFLRMFVISLLGFALTFSSNIQDPPLMTFKTRQLAPDLPNTALGILGFIGLLVAMAVQPIVGAFSDRARSRLGRRLPFIPGLVTESQHGAASSQKGVMDIIALVVGGLVAGKILSAGIDRWG